MTADTDPRAPTPLTPDDSRTVLTAQGMGSVLALLGDELRDELLDSMTRTSLVAGEVVLRAGERADALHVVVSGALRVRLTDPATDHEGDAFIGRGGTVGEEGLLTGAPRTATVVAHRDTVLARLDEAAFDVLLHREPRAVVAAFARPVVDRLRAGGDESARGARRAVIALEPLGPGVDARALADGMAVALRETVGVGARVVDATACEDANGDGSSRAGPDDPAHSRVAAWLDHLETTHDHLVLVADDGGAEGPDRSGGSGVSGGSADDRSEPSPPASGTVAAGPWAERCVRQADVVVLVAMAGSDATRSARESRLVSLRPTTRRHLVLLHPPDTEHATGTGPWLAQRDLAAHHHVRAGHSEDLARAARLVAGRGRGLVLGGGGARAFAQLGVVAVLAERDLLPDAIAATSAGSITGALLAGDVDPASAVRRIASVVDRLDLTLPLHAVTRGRNWTASLARLFGDRRIEDAWRRIVIVSTNLTRGEAHVHRTGPLLDAVRTTTAVPGMLPAVGHDGDVLVDGGLVDNLPTGRLAADPDVDRIVAVEAGAGGVLRAESGFGHDVSGWRTAASWVRERGRGTVPPTLPAVLQASLTLANNQSARATADLADLTIRPPINDVGLMQFDRVTELAHLAAAHAREVLSDDPWR